MRLRHIVSVGPSARETKHLHPDTEVTFAPMEALADGLGGLDTSMVRPLSEVASGSYNFFSNGDLLLAKVTPCFENGKKALAQGLTNGIGYATSEVHVFRPRSDAVDRRYLLYTLSSETFRAAGMKSMTGAGGLRRVSENAILDFRLPVPDLPTQKAIAAFLDREIARIDQLVEKKQRLVELLGEREEAEREARCTSGEPTRLRHIRRYITSGSRGWSQFYADEGDLFVRIGNVSRPGIDLDLSDPAYVSLPSSAEGMRTRLDEGDLLVSITADLGSVAVVDGRAAGAFVSQHVALIKLSRRKACSRYVAHALLTRPAQAQFNLSGYGGTKQGLSLDDVLDISVPLPSLERQRQIADTLDRFSGDMEVISGRTKASIDRLKEYRSALITAVVTGQIDVATWSRRGEGDRRLDRIEEEMAG